MIDAEMINEASERDHTHASLSHIFVYVVPRSCLTVSLQTTPLAVALLWFPDKRQEGIMHLLR
jgi:hypothetical protein